MSIDIPRSALQGLLGLGGVGLALGFVLMLVEQTHGMDSGHGYGIAAILSGTAALVTAILGIRVHRHR